MTKKHIIIIFSVVFLILFLLVISRNFFREDYNIDYVENLTGDIIKHNGSPILIKELLLYKMKTAIDGFYGSHYYANLYYVYNKYPNNMLIFKNSIIHGRTVDKVIKNGKYYFDDVYPNGWK